MSPAGMAKPGLPLTAAAGSPHAWRSRVALGNVGVLALAALPLSGGSRIAACTAALACGARLLDRGLFDRRDLAVLATGIIAA